MKDNKTSANWREITNFHINDFFVHIYFVYIAAKLQLSAFNIDETELRALFCNNLSFYSMPLFLRGREKKGKGRVMATKNVWNSVSTFTFFRVANYTFSSIYNLIDPLLAIW